ncbi:unnamed protein product [Mytilus coruscus]|uniref:Endonuclease/exonuclease/phosphatase domain-containing protein n=1 Tax=Mytilus coruscus TaxID=42192 RepID=A0A6J8B9H2_MYTCO|nr:unnamed protein product [Mytilus coruscus]
MRNTDEENTTVKSLYNNNDNVVTQKENIVEQKEIKQAELRQRETKIRKREEEVKIIERLLEESKNERTWFQSHIHKLESRIKELERSNEILRKEVQMIHRPETNNQYIVHTNLDDQHVRNESQAKQTGLTSTYRECSIGCNINSNDTLDILSFNCKIIKTSGQFFQEIQKSADVLLIQEHWLFHFELELLKELHPNIVGVGKALDSDDPKAASHMPIGYGELNCEPSKRLIDVSSNVSDHHPISLRIKCNTFREQQSKNPEKQKQRVKWNKVDTYRHEETKNRKIGDYVEMLNSGIINIELIILQAMNLLFNTAKQLDQQKTNGKNKLKLKIWNKEISESLAANKLAYTTGKQLVDLPI